MAEAELTCAVYGKGTVFSVKVNRDAKVEALQKAIVYEKEGVNPRFNVNPATVTLYFAKKNGAWLKDDDSVDGFLLGKIDTSYRKMRPSWKLNETEYFGDFQPAPKEIHVLVELPEAVAGMDASSMFQAARDYKIRLMRVEAQNERILAALPHKEP